jgi:hypothetical protein
MKQTITLLLFLQIGIFSHSQIIFGAKSGVNIATTKDLIAFPKNRVGWYGGLTSQISFNKKWSIQPEIIYSSKGYSYVDLYDDKRSSMRLNYLNVPILVGYKVFNKAKILGGAEVGYLLAARNIIGSNNLYATSSFPVRFDIGLVFGLQFDFNNLISAEARYIHGLNTFYQTDVAGVRKSENWAANRVFQFGLIYSPFKNRESHK